MRTSDDSMRRALANQRLEIRPGVTFGAKAMWPFAWVGSLLLVGLSVVGLIVLIRLVME
jgi:hypothetical protein